MSLGQRLPVGIMMTVGRSQLGNMQMHRKRLTRSVKQSKTTTVPRYRQPTRFDVTYIFYCQLIVKLLAWWFTTFIDWFE